MRAQQIDVPLDRRTIRSTNVDLMGRRPNACALDQRHIKSTNSKNCFSLNFFSYTFACNVGDFAEMLAEWFKALRSGRNVILWVGVPFPKLFYLW